MNTHTFRPFMRCAFAATALTASFTTALTTPLMAMENNPPAGGGAHAAAAAARPRFDVPGEVLAEGLIQHITAHGIGSIPGDPFPRHPGPDHSLVTYVQDVAGIPGIGAFNVAIKESPLFNRLRTSLARAINNDNPDRRILYNTLAFYYELVREICVQILLHSAQEPDNSDAALEQLSLEVLSAAQNTYTTFVFGGAIGIPNRGPGFFDLAESFGLHPLPEAIRADVAARRGAHA